MIFKIVQLLLLFVIETIGQVLYYSVRIKFFNKFSTYDNFINIFFDSAYFMGTVKAAFYFPIYFVYYFYMVKNNASKIKMGLYHSIIFLGLSAFLTILLPWGILRNFYDALFLTLISFVSALIIFPLKNTSRSSLPSVL